MLGTPHTNPYTTTGVTSLDIVPSPAASQQHIAQRISVYNADSVSHTYTARLYNGSTHNPIETITVASLATGSFSHVDGHCADGTSKKFTLVVNANMTTTESVVTASYIQNT